MTLDADLPCRHNTNQPVRARIYELYNYNTVLLKVRYNAIEFVRLSITLVHCVLWLNISSNYFHSKIVP